MAVLKSSPGIVLGFLFLYACEMTADMRSETADVLSPEEDRCVSSAARTAREHRKDLDTVPFNRGMILKTRKF